MPRPRAEDWWQQRFEQLNEQRANQEIDLVFIGDSITHGWDGASDIWRNYYARRNALNLGIAGDETSYILWRLNHGNVDGISPKVAVLMIGTNNAGNSHQSADETTIGRRLVDC